MLESRPKGLHPPASRRTVREFSPHTAPIRQTRRPCLDANVKSHFVFGWGLALNWYWWTVLGDAMLMPFLTFFVFDATLFCLLFVNKLRRTQTVWPSTTMGVYRGRLRLQTKLVHDWINLDFVAKRTRCIGSLIYFPFALIVWRGEATAKQNQRMFSFALKTRRVTSTSRSSSKAYGPS